MNGISPTQIYYSQTHNVTSHENSSDWAEKVKKLKEKLSVLKTTYGWTEVYQLPTRIPADLSQVFNTPEKVDVLFSEFVKRGVLQPFEVHDIYNRQSKNGKQHFFHGHMHQLMTELEKRTFKIDALIYLLQACALKSPHEQTLLQETFRSWNTTHLETISTRIASSNTLSDLPANAYRLIAKAFVTRQHLEVLCSQLLDYGILPIYQISDILHNHSDIGDCLKYMQECLQETDTPPIELAQLILNCRRFPVYPETSISTLKHKFQSWDKNKMESLITDLQKIKPPQELDSHFLMNWITFFETKNHVYAFCEKLVEKSIFSESELVIMKEEKRQTRLVIEDIQKRLISAKVSIDSITESIRSCLSMPLN